MLVEKQQENKIRVAILINSLTVIMVEEQAAF